MIHFERPVNFYFLVPSVQFNWTLRKQEQKNF